MTIKAESIVVDAFVAYCDGCGKQGPFALHEKAAAAQELEVAGWGHDFDRDKDYCPACEKAREDAEAEGAEP